MRQRVALARTLAQETPVLLMDEPFGALDAMTRDVLHDEIERIWRERSLTVLFVTHNVREAARLGDRIVLLSSRPGRVVEEYPVDIPRPRRIDSPEVGRPVRDHHRPAPRGGAPSWRADTAPPATTVPPARPGATAQELSGLDALELRPAAARRGSARRLGRRVAQGGGRRHRPARLAARRLVRLAPVLRAARARGRSSPSWAACSASRRSGRPSARPCAGPPSASPPPRSIGLVVGVATARIGRLRVAIGSLITGLQTMPSIAWFPLAILLFQLSENAMYFVVILGAAPSIANGVISGVDYVPPLLQRVGRNLGASGLQLYRPRHHAGVAAEHRGRPQAGLGVRLAQPHGRRAARRHRRDPVDRRCAWTPPASSTRPTSLIAWMIVILVIGILVDVVFDRANTAIRRRWGVVDA